MRSRLEKRIFNLECELLKPEVRSDPAKIRALLSSDFVEYCSSGRVYKYERGDTFEAAPGTVYRIMDFEARRLSRGCVLALYRAVREATVGESTASLRCSVWKRSGGAWKIVFHQGTPDSGQG